MQRFSALFTALDRTTRTSEKIAALVGYLRHAPRADAAWAVYFLSGAKIKRAIKVRELRDLAAEAAGLPAWLVDESYHVVGDLGETLALLLPEPVHVEPPPLHELVEQCTLPLAGLTPLQRRELIEHTWARLDRTQRFLWHKIMLGSFRVGVARRTVIKALAEVAGAPPAVIAHRMAGAWAPTAASLEALLSGAEHGGDLMSPYPFFLGYPLDGEPAALGEIAEWQVEWKYDGIRAQLIHRGVSVLLWSRGEELINPAFPEIEAAARCLPPGTVLDGEVLAWEQDRPLPFALLQRRLNRKQVEPALWVDVPVTFMAFDLLEEDGDDLRALPTRERRVRLERLLERSRDAEVLRPTPLLHPRSWDELAELQARARDEQVEGVMLKRLDEPYGVGRRRGAWWKWKSDPYSIDAVLIYAQPGTGRRSGLLTDFTFGVWDGDELVPIAKSYSGLTDEEFAEVNRFIRRHTIGRHGPVRVVEPALVFEIAFEGIAPSGRHRSGLALRFPRMARWRRDKKAPEADTVETVAALRKSGT